MSGKAMTRLRNCSVAGFVLALLAGFFIPVYADEIGWRFQERAAFDGVDKLFNDICGPNTLAQPPFFMMPARHYSAFFNAAFADPFYVRLSGVLYALAAVVLILLTIRKAAAGTGRDTLLGALGFGLLGIGMTPFIAVWSRPEQPIVLCTLGAILLALPPPGTAARAAAGAWLRVLAIVALWSVAVSYHLKGLFVLPIFAVCLLYAATGRGSLAPRLAGAAAVLAMAASAAAYWLGRLSCPDSPKLSAGFALNSIGSELTSVASFDQAWAVALKMIGNVRFLDYVVLAAPHPEPLSEWLPWNQIGAEAGMIWFAALVCVWGIAALAGLGALVSAARQALAARQLDPRLALAIASLITLTGWSAMQNFANHYEASFVYPLFMLAIVLALSAAAIPDRLVRPLKIFAGTLALAALANPAMLGAIWGPAMARAYAQTGYVKDQPHSVSLRGYSALDRQIRATARLCNMPEPKQARGVLIDDLTYFAYMESRLPQHRLGVLSHWTGEIDDPVAYLKSRKSDGMIVGCHMLSEDLRARARRNGPFCCLAPPNW